MASITIPSSTSFTNLYTLSGIAQGTSLILTNGTASSAYVVQSAVQPSDSSHQYPLMPGQTVVVNGTSDPIWIKGSEGPFFVQTIVDTIMPFTGVDLPEDRYTIASGQSYLKVELPAEDYVATFGKKKLKVELPDDAWTFTEEGFRRIRVDSSQTSFFLGRQFYSFKELSIPAGQSYTIKLVLGVDSVFFDVHLAIDAGSVRMNTYAGGTPSGTFSETLPIIAKNTMSSRRTPLYSSVNSLTAGGSVSGGTVYDTLRIVAANATAQQQTVGTGDFTERGRPAGTYYWTITNIGSGTVTGTFFTWWEER